MRIHVLKCDAEPFMATIGFQKSFEYRKNDRGFCEGDYLELVCGAIRCLFHVDYIMYGGQYGIPEGYCVMSISRAGSV